MIKRNVFLILILILILLTGLPAGAQLSTETLDNLSKNVCAQPLKPAEVKTEGGGLCSECLKKENASLGKNQTDLQPIVNKIEDQARVERELKFLQLANKEGDVEDRLTKVKFKLEEAAAHQLEKNEGALLSESFQMLMKYGSTQGKFQKDKKGFFIQNLQRLKALSDERMQIASKALASLPEVEQDGSTYDIQLAKHTRDSRFLEKTLKIFNADKIFYWPQLKVFLQRRIETYAKPEDIKFWNEQATELEKTIKQRKLKKVSKGEADRQDLAALEKIAIDRMSVDPEDPQYCGMSIAEIQALQDYTSNGYQKLNEILRFSAGEKNEAYEAYRDVLNSALKKLNSYKGPVLRGTTLSPEQVALHQVGTIVTYPAFTSTSVTSGFGGDQRFVIQSKNGHFIAPFSSSKTENEVLFPANTKFKVLNVEKTNDKTEITLEEVD